MDFSKHLTDSWSHNTAGYWRTYAFPNGHDVSVILDPHEDRPFRFKVESTDPDDYGVGGTVGNLTTEQVEAKLTKVAALPDNEETS